MIKINILERSLQFVEFCFYVVGVILYLLCCLFVLSICFVLALQDAVVPCCVFCLPVGLVFAKCAL